MDHANVEELCAEYGIEVKSTWALYKIYKNLYIVERPRMKAEYATLEYVGKSLGDPGISVIFLRGGLSNKAKALALQHELIHMIQFRTEEVTYKKISSQAKMRRKERMAEEMELILTHLIRKYPPYAKGVAEIKHASPSGITPSSIFK